MQRRLTLLMILILSMLNIASTCWGLTITEPKQGSVFYSGNKVTVRAEPYPGENISSVYFAVPQMGKGTIDFIPPYEFSFNIDADFVGAETIMADAKLSNTTHVQAQVQIIVGSNSGDTILNR